MLLAQLAEVDERKLYLPAAYPSMFAYCVGELLMSEDMALMRVRVARMVRQFPAIFPALADGRLNLTTVLLLAPHLSPETAEALLVAAGGKRKDQIRLLLAERYPQPDVPTLVQAAVAPGASDAPAAQPADAPALQLGPDPVVPSLDPNGAECMEPLPSRARLAPLSPGRFALRLTVDQETHDLLRYVQALLGHTLPSGDVPRVIKRALASLARELEKQKFAKCERSRSQRGAANGRHIPAAVKRAVWKRDGGQCTFVSKTGRPCESRTRVETLWNDGLAVVMSSCLREEKPTAVARGHPGSRVSASGARAAYEGSPS